MVPDGLLDIVPAGVGQVQGGHRVTGGQGLGGDGKQAVRGLEEITRRERMFVESPGGAFICWKRRIAGPADLPGGRVYQGDAHGALDEFLGIGSTKPQKHIYGAGSFYRNRYNIIPIVPSGTSTGPG